ncbi:MAG: hypothetical protein H7Y01_06325, partial [Ferruginibacter sp.]|nr:hypothetical protein [Chitinophagaceae bacterium]
MAAANNEMKLYFGKIEIGALENKQILSTGMTKDDAVFFPMSESNTRFVHYPDCQQLIIWLTHPGREYGRATLRDTKNKKVVEEWSVTDRLNGSIQVVWDTLPVAPGAYSIEIEWKNGWQHQISFVKYKENDTPPLKDPVIPANNKEEKTQAPIQYRDGFGNEIENEDMVLREKLIKDIARKFTRHIEYEGNVRAGTIIYTDGEVRIEFSHEMGGGNCMFYIDIPSEQQWEMQTKTALAARKEILEFVALRV